MDAFKPHLSGLAAYPYRKVEAAIKLDQNESPWDLPDDLMIEALGIEETRQYCRNIVQASVMYGELYYGKNVGETVRELVEGYPAN